LGVVRARHRTGLGRRARGMLHAAGRARAAARPRRAAPQRLASAQKTGGRPARVGAALTWHSSRWQVRLCTGSAHPKFGTQRLRRGGAGVRHTRRGVLCVPRCAAALAHSHPRGVWRPRSVVMAEHRRLGAPAQCALGERAWPHAPAAQMACMMRVGVHDAPPPAAARVARRLHTAASGRVWRPVNRPSRAVVGVSGGAPLMVSGA